MDKETIAELANSVNDVVASTSRPLNDEISRLKIQIEKYKNAIQHIYDRFEERQRSHSFHKHHHYGCIFCDIEKALK